ncbi:MAG TPA: lysophospholipid acyltransferase family protein [Sedimentisphaerales bacterium]|nr:lysophospholipid acyltransferase family protein [Sedimentisphaerales bacterium]HRS11030.1 lysophospholipid acyltransferase family protein [Sedimentisphaerales bacterium]HRV49254.1 lysophospholipid acyltransferase family protein [Sedimentisphaerales bacterium]
MHKLLTIVFASLFNILLRCVCGSNRLTVTNERVFRDYVEQGGNIFAFWHSRLFYLVYFYVKHAQRCKVAMLVSLSRDGDYGAALVRKLRQDAVRGSTSRGGQRAVRRLAAKIAEGRNIAITPDGPRGPALHVNEGIVKLAQITGARIIPVSYDATHKRLLKSWDRFLIVWPFGRVHVAFGEPVEVPKNITRYERSQYRAGLEQTLHELDRICARELARGRVTTTAQPIAETAGTGPQASPRQPAG